MELTREQQQFILDVLADICGRQLGVILSFKLIEESEDKESEEESEPIMTRSKKARMKYAQLYPWAKQ